MLFVCSQTETSGVYYRGQLMTFVYVVRRPPASLLLTPLSYWIDFGYRGAARQKLNGALRPLATVVAVELDCLDDSKRPMNDELDESDEEADNIVGGTVTHRFISTGTYQVINDASNFLVEYMTFKL